MDLFDQKARGGAFASRVDQQDGVAALIALECVRSSSRELPFIGFPERISVSFEVNEDVSFVGDEGIIIVSVKTSPMSEVAIYKELASIEERAASYPNVNYVLAIVDASTADSVKVKRSLNELRNVMGSRLACEAVADWRNLNNEASAVKHPSRAYVIEYPKMDSSVYEAAAAQGIRAAVPVSEYTDESLRGISAAIHSIAGGCRRDRRTIMLEDLLKPLSDYSSIDRIFPGILNGYVKTRYGYAIDPKKRQAWRENERIKYRSAVNVMRRYRKAALPSFLKNILYRGPVCCIACGGVHLANLGGLRMPGIACSDCGFTPYVSVLYACECEESILVQKQPDASVSGFLFPATRLIGTECPKCGKTVDAENLTGRLYQLNIPWPPESYSDSDLIEARKSAGLKYGGLGKEEILSCLEDNITQEKVDGS